MRYFRYIPKLFIIALALLFQLKLNGRFSMKLITVHLPEAYLKGLDKLVKRRMYPNRSEAIRIAVRDLLKRELWEQVKLWGDRL